MARAHAVASGIALAATVVVAVLAPRPLIDRDEAATLYSTGLSWHALLQEAHVQDAVLVPYYLLLDGLNQVAAGLVADRLLSVAAYGATVVLAGLVAARLSVNPTTAAFVASLAAATNTLLVQQAVNARPYALVAALSLLAIWALLVSVQESRPVLVHLATGATAAAELLHFLGVLAPLAVLAALLVTRRQWARSAWRELVVYGVVVGGLLVPLLLAAATQKGQLSWLTAPGVADAVRQLTAPFGMWPLAALPQVALVAVAVLAARWTLRRRRGLTLLLAAWLVLPSLILLAVSSWTPLFGQRYVVASAPAAGVLAAVALDGANLKLRRVVVLALSLALVVNFAGDWRALMRPLSIDRFQAAADYVDRNARPGDIVALPNHDVQEAVGLYLRRRDVRLWPSVPVRRLESLDLADSAATVHSEGSRVWVVDMKTPYDAAGLRQFVARLRAAGYLPRVDERFGPGDTSAELFTRAG
jgi:hypothetical protein